VTRAYGKLQIRKKTKSTRDVKLNEKTLQHSPANEKIDQVPKVQTEKNLQRFSRNLDEIKTISHLILKSKSDKLDLKRDLATYEFYFLQSWDFRSFMVKLEENYKKLSLGDELSLSMNKLSSEIKMICQNEFRGNRADVGSVFSEWFPVKLRKNEQVSQDFKGVVEISGVRCLVAVRSTMFYYHSISCLLPDDQKLAVKVEKDISDVLTTDENIQKFEFGIKSRVIPFLYLNSKESDLKLIFDECFLDNKVVFYLKILGISRKITLVIQEIEENFCFEIKNTKLSLFLEKLTLKTRTLDIETRKKLKDEVKKHLFVYKGRLVWGKHPFLMRENSSRLLDGDFLKQAFDTNLVKAFSLKFRNKNCLIKVEGFELKNKKYLKMTKNRSTVTIYDDSFEFFLIFGLQSLNFYKNSVTLEASLEIKMVADMIFN
jgi:hypothetical protein